MPISRNFEPDSHAGDDTHVGGPLKEALAIDLALTQELKDQLQTWEGEIETFCMTLLSQNPGKKYIRLRDRASQTVARMDPDIPLHEDEGVSLSIQKSETGVVIQFLSEELHKENQRIENLFKLCITIPTSGMKTATLFMSRAASDHRTQLSFVIGENTLTLEDIHSNDPASVQAFTLQEFGTNLVSFFELTQEWENHTLGDQIMLDEAPIMGGLIDPDPHYTHYKKDMKNANLN